MKAADLTPNPKNPRKISDEKLAMLKASLAEFGDLSGIVFNRETKRLVGGHQRAKAIPAAAVVTIERKFKKPTRTGTVAEGFLELDGERMAYREVRWDDLKEKAANIAANKHGGEWDLPALNEWLLELDAANFNMDLTGFTAKELEDLMAPVTKVEGQCDEDEVPELKKAPKAKLGDVYRLGRHRLMCGDSTALDQVEALLAKAQPEMVFTDPPYGIAHSGKGTDGAIAGNDFGAILGDDDVSVAVDAFNLCTGLLPAATLIFWGANYYCSALPNGHGWLVWDKQREGNTFSGAELAFVNRGVRLDVFRHMWHGMVKASEHGQARVHPTQKPIALAEWCFENYGKPSAVLDLFGGSGSTLIACEKTDRTCFMMELDPRYCDVILQRWCKFTGKVAYRLNDDGSQTAWTGLETQGRG